VFGPEERGKGGRPKGEREPYGLSDVARSKLHSSVLLFASSLDSGNDPSKSQPKGECLPDLYRAVMTTANVSDKPEVGNAKRRYTTRGAKNFAKGQVLAWKTYKRNYAHQPLLCLDKTGQTHLMPAHIGK